MNPRTDVLFCCAFLWLAVICAVVDPGPESAMLGMYTVISIVCLALGYCVREAGMGPRQ